MNKIETLTAKVRELYESNAPERDTLADWLYENHIFQVAKEARSVAERFGGDPDLAEAAGMLHDIADAVMGRFEPLHGEKSENIARRLLSDSGFSKEEIEVVVDDSIQHHSCRDGNVPTTPEGKAVATGDAIVHLTTDFYAFMVDIQIKRGDSNEMISKWAKEKLNRDFTSKIFFDEIRTEVAGDHERLQKLFVS